MKPVIIIAIIVSSITIFSILPDAEAKTWKVHIMDMPKQWQSQFGHLYDEGTKYWEEQIPGTYFTEIAYREKADFAIQWSSKFEGDRLGYYTTDVDNDFGIPFIAITIGYMDDDESIKWQDRKFNLVDPEYAKLITIHELGHAIGLDHSKNPDDIMYPSIYNYDLWLSQKQSAVLETQIVTSTVEPTKNIELELINSIYQKISNVLSNTDYSLDEPTVFSFDDDSIKTGYVIHSSDGESFGGVNIWSENNVVNRLEIATSHFNDFDSKAIATIALAGMIKGVMDTNEYDVEDFIEMFAEAADDFNYETKSIRNTPSGHKVTVNYITIVEGVPGLTVMTFNIDYKQRELTSPGAISTSEYEDIRNQMGMESCETKECAEAQSWAMQEYAKETGQYVDPFASQLPKESGGGCLIATATYGSELAPQVQQLREIRDNQLLNTESGTSFINSFNDFYYSFSPIIADYERENPVFKEMVKIAVTPMITSLSILNYVDMDSEIEVLGYGISLIMLNLGMYLGVPAVVIIGIRKIK